jgi:hypothetical protein
VCLTWAQIWAQTQSRVNFEAGNRSKRMVGRDGIEPPTQDFQTRPHPLPQIHDSSRSVIIRNPKHHHSPSGCGVTVVDDPHRGAPGTDVVYPSLGIAVTRGTGYPGGWPIPIARISPATPSTLSSTPSSPRTSGALPAGSLRPGWWAETTELGPEPRTLGVEGHGPLAQRHVEVRVDLDTAPGRAPVADACEGSRHTGRRRGHAGSRLHRDVGRAGAT